ncbi:MAG: DUF624 domain-containing protein [Clostridiales bacterium]|nr:DUF624 domain-containing protein [Clostridiales bacterium]
MGKLFNKMYIGNPKKSDLTKEQVDNIDPLKLFITVFQVRGLKLILLNLMYCFFLIPMAVNVYLALLGYLDEPQFATLIPYIYAALPCMLIATPGKLGFTNVLMRWAADEHAWLWSDFWEGIKKNWKQGLLLTVTNYLIFLFLIFVAWFYVAMANAEDPNMISAFAPYVYYLILGVILVFMMISIYTFPLSQKYKFKFKYIYKYSFMLCVRKFLPTFLAVVLSGLAIYGLVYVAAMYFIWLLLVVPVIGFSLYYLVMYIIVGRSFKNFVFLPER